MEHWHAIAKTSQQVGLSLDLNGSEDQDLVRKDNRRSIAHQRRAPVPIGVYTTNSDWTRRV